MDIVQGFDRGQLQMMTFDEYVAVDSWARVVDLFVDLLPLKVLGFKSTLGKERRPPFDPSDMLKLYLYGYKNQLRSFRKLAHGCTVNLEVMWLLKGLRPSARKIAYFRKDNPKSFNQAFRHFVLLLKNGSDRWRDHRHRFLQDMSTEQHQEELQSKENRSTPSVYR